MKKYIFVVAITLIGLISSAQDPTTMPGKKPTGVTGATGIIQKYPNGAVGNTGDYPGDPKAPGAVSGKNDNDIRVPSTPPQRDDVAPGASGPTGDQKPPKNGSAIPQEKSKK